MSRAKNNSIYVKTDEILKEKFLSYFQGKRRKELIQKLYMDECLECLSNPDRDSTYTFGIVNNVSNKLMDMGYGYGYYSAKGKRCWELFNINETNLQLADKFAEYCINELKNLCKGCEIGV